MEDQPNKLAWVPWLGLLMGPLVACLLLWALPSSYTLPPSPAEVAESVSNPVDINASALPVVKTFSWAGRATLAVMVWMGIWWLTEAIEISVTALLPLVLFPLLDAASMSSAAAPYANHLIFLYFGGFVLALSMARWGLGKRIALLTLRYIGTSASRMIAGFMAVTAVLSAFVSNTATTAMMLPIALSTIALIKDNADNQSDESSMNCFGTCLLLAIAYSASVGGIMTIIGTPTNAFLIGFLRESPEPLHKDVSFLEWLPVGVSLAVVFLPIMYLVLTKLLFPIGKVRLRGGREMIQQELDKLGPVNRGEWNTLIVFCSTVLLWLTRPWLNPLSFDLGGTQFTPLAGLTDTGIAMTAAVVLFLLPVNAARREFTMNWETTNKMPWGILLLFGGGLSLAAAVQENGVAEFIGSHASNSADWNPWLVVLAVTTAIVFLTELTSNVATTTSLVPVLAAIAPAIGIHPYLLIVPATVAASCAFMLPVATPPNAIVFGSGEITVGQMVRAGIVLNLIAIVIVTCLAMTVYRYVFV